MIFQWCIVLHVSPRRKSKQNHGKFERPHETEIGQARGFRKMMGKLMYATIGIPNGRGLLSLIIAMVATKERLHNYKNKTTKLNQATCQALQDWLTLLPHALQHPTPCTNLLPALSNFGGFCDASKQGTSGIWFGFGKNAHPLYGKSNF